MAVQGYSYNPEAKKSGTVAEIKSDIEQLGLALDAQQASMGLIELERCFASNRIENNGSLDNYFDSFETRYTQVPHQFDVENKPQNQVPPDKLEELILLALAEKWQSREYFTTTEIAQLINKHFKLEDKPKSKNNISRYFNQTFHPYYEIKLIDGKRKYRLSSTGYGRARILGVVRQ